MTLPLRPQETSVARPLVNLLPPGEEECEAEMNLAFNSDSLPLGTPSLTAKPKVLEIADRVEILTKSSPVEFAFIKVQH